MITRTNLARALRQTAMSKRTIRTLSHPRLLPATIHKRCATHIAPQLPIAARYISTTITTDSDSSSTPITADGKISELTELLATAQDEFEIAMHETQTMSIYAESDRRAAREELNRVGAVYRAVLEGPDAALAAEVKNRTGHRIRQLEQDILELEEMALNQDSSDPI